MAVRPHPFRDGLHFRGGILEHFDPHVLERVLGSLLRPCSRIDESELDGGTSPLHATFAWQGELTPEAGNDLARLEKYLPQYDLLTKQSLWWSPRLPSWNSIWGKSASERWFTVTD